MAQENNPTGFTYTNGGELNNAHVSTMSPPAYDNSAISSISTSTPNKNVYIVGDTQSTSFANNSRPILGFTSPGYCIHIYILEIVIDGFTQRLNKIKNINII